MILVVLGMLTWCVGLLLCFTIILAPVGWILMFIGGIMALFGILGRRRTVITNVVQVSNMPGGGMQANIPLDVDRREPMRMIEAGAQGKEPDHFVTAPVIDVTPRESQRFVYDHAKWNTLIRYDAEIGKIVSILTPYGQKYVDEFAAAYLALNDKSYLPMIIQKILATAKDDAARHR